MCNADRVDTPQLMLYLRQGDHDKSKHTKKYRAAHAAYIASGGITFPTYRQFYTLLDGGWTLHQVSQVIRAPHPQCNDPQPRSCLYQFS